MRVLRASLYSDPRRPPTIAVVREDQTTDTLESIRLSARQPGSLLVSEIFDVEEGTSVEEATLDGTSRAAHALREVERHQVTLYFYLAQQLATIPRGMSACTPGPTPLNREQVAEVLEQLAQHPAFERNKLGVPDSDGDMVILSASGRIE